ncbi:MAG TPA: alpha/beta hydrolase [Lacisediminihabitans sp.]|uniref:esterase/lipase family protein n=1 Tax=Lacisediminihabitans sp. TaxID=2787631 RepID=UPI002ED9EC2B
MGLLRDLGLIVADRGYQVLEQARHLLRPTTPERYLGGDRPPVLLLPGIYETWQFLLPVADRLHRLGHPIHVLTGLGYNRGTIPDAAALAERYLEDRDLRGVILVAHSKGGIIGKRLMVDDRDGRIARLIAVNSPFGGSSLARFAPNRALRVFSPRDPILTALAANLEANSRITSIYSRLDPLIPEGSRLEGATNVELDLVGHFRPLGSVRLMAEVENAIAPR